MNLGAIEPEIERLVDALTDATDYFARLATDAGNAEVEYKVAFARALLAADGTVAEREARATVETVGEFMARRSAEAKLSSQREVLATIREQLGALRTLAASARSVTS